jgi:hypothetical protein
MGSVLRTVFQFATVEEVEIRIAGSCRRFGKLMQTGRCDIYTRDQFQHPLKTCRRTMPAGWPLAPGSIHDCPLPPLGRPDSCEQEKGFDARPRKVRV